MRPARPSPACTAPAHEHEIEHKLAHAPRLRRARAPLTPEVALSPRRSLHGVLQRHDVLSHVDGLSISNDGRVRREDMSPLDFRVCFSLKLVGEPISLTVFRRGVRLEVTTATERLPELIPSTWFARPSYVLVAGFVFVPMQLHDADDGASERLDQYISGLLAESGFAHSKPSDQVVILSGAALPHAVTLGYEEEDFERTPLLSVDGRQVRNLADVASFVESAAGPLVTFLFALDKEIVLPLAEGKAATVELMREFGIAAPWSADISAELKERRAAAAAAAAAAAPAAAAAAAPAPPAAGPDGEGGGALAAV